MDVHFGSMDGTERSGSPADSSQESPLAVPLHLQRLERALRVDLLMRQVQSIVTGDADIASDEMLVPISKQQMRTIKTKAYNLSKVKKSKKWIKSALIEKSSSESSDPADDSHEDDANDDHVVHQLIKFQNFKRKVRNDFLDGSDSSGAVAPALKSFKSYSSSLLSSSLTPSFVPPADPPLRTPAKSMTDPKCKKSRPAAKSIPKRKKLGSETAAVPVPTITVTSARTASPTPLIRSETASITDTMSVSTTSTPPLAASLTLSVSDSVDSIKKFKLEKMLDEIPYDMTLPDEILQTESSDAAPSPSTAPTDDIVYSSLLPDEIFEESSNSLLSQTLSSPSSVAVLSASTGSHKAATAPPTPTGLSGSVSSKNVLHTKWKAIRRQQTTSSAAVTTSAPTSVQPQSPEPSVSAKRKKVWSAVLKCIPKTQEQVMKERRDGLENCRRISSWCRDEHANILKRWSLLTEDGNRDLRREMLSFWDIPLPPVESEPEDEPEVVMESMGQLFDHVHDVL